MWVRRATVGTLSGGRSRRIGAAPALEVVRGGLGDPAVEAAWRGLQAAGHVPSPFLSWQWYSAMRDVPELAGRVEVLMARRAGRTVGLLPVERVRSGPLRVLGVAGWTWLAPDHLDVVAAAGHRPAVAGALLGALRERRDWDMLDMDGLQPAGGLDLAVPEVFGSRRFLLRAPEDVPVSYVPLRGSIVSSHARKKVRKELRRAEESGGGFAVVTEPDQFPPLLEQMMRFHNSRFQAASQVFATPARQRFHLLAAGRLGASGLARMHCLNIGETYAAINYCLVWETRMLFYSSGLRSDLGINPGFSVRVSAMLAAAEDGFTEVDLLRGDHGHKERFTSIVRTDVRHRVVRPSVRVASTGILRAGRRAIGLLAAAGRRNRAGSGT